MFDHRFSLDSPTGALLNVFRADARAHERGILLVFHGLAEHAERYGRFAGEMAERGFHVYAHDHRGHGSTTASDAPLRRFAKRDGAAKVVGDCRAVFDRARAEHRRGLPIIVFGHSMGGLVALNFALRLGPQLAGLAIWNADPAFGYRERLGVAALKAERALKGSDVASDLFARSTFQAWARSVENRRTDGDWLSHDEAQVDRYLNDPLCGWTPTNSMALDVLELIRGGSTEAAWAALPDGLPVHVLGGTEDPAARRGEAAHALAGGLRHAGSRDVTLLVQEGARHETLNEIEPIRAAALGSFERWLDRIAPEG
ncbi:alpha/beta fold hydrolase [Aureimonas leprariae]|uniref:Alpha/beta hydrolase n=1 Tax=Plantimonas leprariae TaxID=2615207 RepID=A0A7V7PQY5_9HYPH|nr:alpha/beta hydrolase [Aureimonas leprariae]KAB0680797.1 alpha/beta hydrolase [Aureimonas leprariae]